MSVIHVGASLDIDARPEDAYAVIADYRTGHPAILPQEHVRDLMVEEGGYGAGTIIRFVSRVLGREHAFRQVVCEPEPGRVLIESDLELPRITTFTFTPLDNGARVRVRIATEMDASDDVQGIVERIALPRIMPAIYRRELGQLAQLLQPDAAVLRRT